VHDPHQEVLEYKLDISPEGLRQDFDDVFGNHSTVIDLDTPFTELTIHSHGLVRVKPVRRGDLRSPSRHSTIPLVWMPWQRQMMNPYLLPPELPATQLAELFDYAMSFVERQDYGLVETLVDMNLTIYRDYAYVSGSTTLETTPFEVYSTRRGVCQDFANLLICMARLIGVPARYRVGYIYTGADYENKVQSDASHAWVELYLPWAGWRGFDPTNGCLANTDHLLIACGRHDRDATPTSGTIYRGGGGETLQIDVRVEPVDEPSEIARCLPPSQIGNPG
jgi:transglutaminase-like putative cysteine protease